MKLRLLTLRDLFWLVLVCALAVGWWVEHREKARMQAERDKLAGNLSFVESWLAHRRYLVLPDWADIMSPGTWLVPCDDCERELEPRDDETHEDTIRRAIAEGWWLNGNGSRALCPDCLNK